MTDGELFNRLQTLLRERASLVTALYCSERALKSLQEHVRHQQREVNGIMITLQEECAIWERKQKSDAGDERAYVVRSCEICKRPVHRKLEDAQPPFYCAMHLNTARYHPGLLPKV